MLDYKIKNSKFFNLLLISSLYLYSFFGILFSVYQVDYYRIPQVLGFLLFIYIIFNLFRKYIKSSQKNFLFSTLIIWQIFIIIRVDDFSSSEVRLVLYEPIHLLSYLIPFLFFFPVNMNSLNKIFNALFFFSLVFMLLHLFLIYQYPVNNFTDIVVLSSLGPAAILLLLSKYISRKQIIGVIIIILSILVIGLIYGRRSVIVNAALSIIFGFGINVLLNKRINFVLKFFFTFFVAILIIYLVNFFLFSADQNNFAIFNRIDEDSRSYVIDAFLKDFKPIDYLIGRGIDGTYYNPIQYWNLFDDDYREVSNRTNIENGFLYIIMKGGIIYLFIFMTILLKAMYLGFFKSNNLLVKGLASYLLIYLIDMIAYGQPLFSIKYCLLWICISCCYSKNFRMIDEIKLAHCFDVDAK